MAEDLLKIYEETFKQMLKPVKNVPFFVIIKGISDKEVLQYDETGKAGLVKAARAAATKINAAGITSARPNEVGNYIEPYVIDALNKNGFTAAKPSTPAKGVKSAGYPDIYAVHSGKSFYIECKTYAEKNVATTQRSFYLSPSTDFKVTRDAFHLVFAYSIKPVGTGLYKTDGFRILDIRSLLCDLKYEFQSDNRRLYSTDKGSILIYRERIVP